MVELGACIVHDRGGRLDHRPNAIRAAVAFFQVRDPAQIAPDDETWK